MTESMAFSNIFRIFAPNLYIMNAYRLDVEYGNFYNVH